MRFMVIVHPGDRKGYENGKMPEPRLLEEMGAFNEELVKAGATLELRQIFEPEEFGPQIAPQERALQAKIDSQLRR